MITELKDITGSLTKALDIIYVLEGAKPVSRIMLTDKDILNFLKEHKLSYEISDFKVLKHTDKTRGYSDKGIKVNSSDNGNPFLYISKNISLAKKAKEHESNNNHLELGKLLGYPECCCRFFEQNIQKASKTTNDLTLNSFSASKGFDFPWQNNNCLRGFDISLLSHFPCSFHCEESKKIAEKNLDIIEQHDSDIASYFKFALKCALIYSNGIGVYSINRYKKTHLTLDYHPKDIIPSSKNDFFNVLLKNNKLTILSKNNFTVGKMLIEDSQTFLGIFS
jgi:hypothetical protein